MSAIHVLFITPGFAANEEDSVAIPVLQALVKQLTKNGIRVSVIAIDYPANEGTYVWNGVQVFSCGGNNRGWPFKFLTLSGASAQFNIINREHAVDVIHSFWWQDTAMLGNYLANKHNVAHLTTLMGQDVLPANRYAKWFSAQGKKVVTLSDFHERYFENTFGRPADKIIKWGIDSDDFITTPSANREIDIMGAGGLNTVKDYAAFIDVVSLVRVKFPEVRCVIAGDGEQRKALESKVASLQLQANITFKGMLSRSETLALMQRSKVFLHTSKFESFGYVFAEALCAGAKIVSYAVGMADASNALVSDTTQQLANNVCMVLESEQQYISQVPFTLQQTAEAYSDFYKELTT